MFQTAFPSGAFPFLLPSPLAESLDEDTKPFPDLATSRGLEVVDVVEAGVTSGDVAPGVAPFLFAVELEELLAAKNFLFTDTALNVAGFFTVDELRTWPSELDFDLSASLSDPPLMLPSVDGTPSSVVSGFGVDWPSLAPSFTDSGLL